MNNFAIAFCSAVFGIFSLFKDLPRLIFSKQNLGFEAKIKTAVEIIMRIATDIKMYLRLITNFSFPKIKMQFGANIFKVFVNTST